MTEVRRQKTEISLPLVFCHLFSVLCPLYVPDASIFD